MVKEKLTQDAAMGNSGMGAGTDGELYCLCRTPYDPLRFMIGCDGCDQWFHGECVGVSESESELVDMYYCPDCTDKGHQSSWKTKCANPACNKPALLPQGKYCTRACGMIVAHARLTQSEAKRRAILGESNYHGHARSGLVSAADMDDRKRLIQVREQQGKVRRAIELIERRTRFLKKVVRRAMVMRAGGENGVPVTVSPQKTTKSKGKGKKGAGGEEDGALCGFDFRLVWDDGKWRDGDENFDGSDDDLSDVDMSEDGKKSGRVCRDPKKKCGKHVGWQKLKMLEVEQEKGIQTHLLTKLGKEEKQIKARMKR
ncbi:hypothetical protein BC936DRAFT_143904, partial [Jimgerdemannia flammicorona]